MRVKNAAQRDENKCKISQITQQSVNLDGLNYCIFTYKSIKNVCFKIHSKMPVGSQVSIPL